MLDKDIFLVTFRRVSKKHSHLMSYSGLPRWLSGKESACNAGDVGLIPESGRSPGGGHSYPLQHSCLENSMDRGAWQATVLGVAELDMTKATEHTHIPVLKTDMDLRGNRSFKC